MLLPSNVSANTLATPSNEEESLTGLLLFIPETGVPEEYNKNFALVTSMVLCNKTSSNVGVFAKVVNGDNSAYFLHNLDLPPGVSFDVIQGNKITLKEGDYVYVWHNGSLENSIDVIFSYTLHSPMTTYDI